MRIASVKPDQLAIVKDDSFVLISDALAERGALPRGASMVDLISRYDSVRGEIADAVARGAQVRQDPKQLLPPVAAPSKIWAAASNYRRGGTGLESGAGRGAASSASNEEILDMAFLKPPSAITGPEGQVIIPGNAETIFPELSFAWSSARRRTTCRGTARWRLSLAIRSSWT
jgi:2-keto-4-pentenoate hydratase/2-oxohepta-3-ene-1,7-dioic acid hydratase in catechol pathway